MSSLWFRKTNLSNGAGSQLTQHTKKKKERGIFKGIILQAFQSQNYDPRPTMCPSFVANIHHFLERYIQD
jgi:hypothetical protein